jgi:hypothetical protein
LESDKEEELCNTSNEASSDTESVIPLNGSVHRMDFTQSFTQPYVSTAPTYFPPSSPDRDVAGEEAEQEERIRKAEADEAEKKEAFDKSAKVFAASTYFQLKLPPKTKDNFHVLSFRFAFDIIISEALKRPHVDFGRLCSVVTDPKSLESCVGDVNEILVNHTSDEYLSNIQLAYDDLRVSFIVPYVARVLLLPIFVGWFPMLVDGPCVIKGTLKGKSVDLLVQLTPRISCLLDISVSNKTIRGYCLDKKCEIDYFA